MAKYRLLIVDDEPRMTQVLGLLAQRWGYEVKTAGNAEEALKTLEDFAAEILVTDLKMPGMGGDELLKHVREKNQDLMVIMMTAHATVKSAVEAMKLGAFDYIMKPFDNDELRITLERATEYVQLKTDNEFLRRELGSRYDLDNIIGESPQINQIKDLVERVAPTKATVLITGESGTGKELVARAIHFRSTRAKGAYIRVNCAALAETLLESELFGHEKGAFTGAIKTHRGRFEEADGGTIFLDEIGETENSFQVKLLRVLQEGTLSRVGSSQNIKVDVRVVAATNRNLKAEVEAGRFREDLFFRLNVLPIHLPPLRERREDIPAIATHFIRKAAEENGLPPKTLSQDAIVALQGADWRGNVRELENCIERSIILTRGSSVTAEDLWLPSGEAPLGDRKAGPKPVLAAAATSGNDSGLNIPNELMDQTLPDFLDEMSKIRVLHALEQTQWRKQEAAEMLGIDRATLYRQIKKFGIGQD